MKKILTINAPARIHFGFLDLEEDSSRKYGSLGLTISNFSYKIKIESCLNNKVVCKNKFLASKIKKIIKEFSEITNLENCKITVFSEIPMHHGLGSGTQLALSVGQLLCKFNNLKIGTNKIACLLGRGQRSGIGIESFRNGGFNIDVGKIKSSNDVPLNILNLKWPQEWAIILILDENLTGTHGKKEIEEFRRLKKVKKNQTNINCKSLLMKIIPGIIEKKFNEFSSGIRIIQDNMSKIFYGSTNKVASELIQNIFKELRKNKIFSYGQSSWGPTGFVVCENLKKRNELLNFIENYINLNNMNGLKLVEVEGKNIGKNIIKKEEI
jgi:beta-RFAP synthase